MSIFARPSDQRFFGLFREQSVVLLEGVQHLVAHLGEEPSAVDTSPETGADQPANSRHDEMVAIASRSAELRHRILVLTRSTMIPPFDAVDIALLTIRVDDAVIAVADCYQSVVLAAGERTPPLVVDMFGLIQRGAELLVEALHHLPYVHAAVSQWEEMAWLAGQARAAYWRHVHRLSRSADQRGEEWITKCLLDSLLRVSRQIHALADTLETISIKDS